MPGVGKATLVKEVVRQVKEDKLFDSVVMAVVTRTPDVQKIQDQIADMLGLKFEEQSMTGRASRLCQRLKKEKNILVVLDDIWEKLNLMEVGIPLGDEDQRCTILLTSRDLNVLKKDMDAKKSFPIGVLEHEEAWHFFKKIIGDGVESSDLLPIATEVAKKCGGLPIAIRTLATSLRNEPPFVWEDALRQLSKPSSSNFAGVPATVYSTIEWSYDRLQSEDHKQTFLLCSLLGHNVLLDLLLVFAMGLGLFHGVSTIKETRNKLLTVVSDLKASCLLLDGNTNLQFDMHDLISDVAMSIASKGKPVFVLRRKHDLNDWPDDETMKECDKILCGGISELPDQLNCPKLTFLSMGRKDPWMKIPTTFFKETKNLKVLFLVSMNLPSSISLLGNLRVLLLILFPKLEKLKPSSVGIERIWSSQAFCSTQNLTSLIIQGCANLKYVLSDSMPEYLQQLKCLEISECKCIQEIISTDKMIQQTFKNRALIRFPRLNFLKLKGLQKLLGFCNEDYTVEFPLLTILEIENWIHP
ncbi:disease resistance protein [Gossypium australe]|uniref:Disease resistance protein n=1 Tax=Gossypium australe TaxID=47621 RepID=A0A5B6VSX6_9ROSI|nr:disease resistance protein [Gossypium australe]